MGKSYGEPLPKKFDMSAIRLFNNILTYHMFYFFFTKFNFIQSGIFLFLKVNITFTRNYKKTQYY